MNILNVNSYYYSSTVHRQLQKGILSQGINSITYVPLAKGYTPREECQYGFESNVVVSECYNNIDRIIFQIKHNKILKDLKKRVKVEEYGCIHAHSLFSNGYVALKMKEKYGIPYIVTVRDTDLNTFFKYMFHLRKLGKKILKEAHKIVFLSKSYRDFLILNYISEKDRKEISTKSVVIPNGIDEFWLNNKGDIKKIQNKDSIKLIHVGVISKRKNILTTVKAIEMLRKKGYEIKYTIVGKIIDKNIFNKIKNLPYVNYIEPKPKEELLKIYRENDILVMPSITESFGLVYAEAMSQGLPVIYTKGQGFDQQFDEGIVGYHVDCFDVYDINEKIIDVIDSYEELSKNSLRHCNKFNWANISTEYIKIYNSINVSM